MKLPNENLFNLLIFLWVSCWKASDFLSWPVVKTARNIWRRSGSLRMLRINMISLRSRILLMRWLGLVIRKKVFIRDVERKYSPKKVVELLHRSSKEVVTSARRKTNRDGSFTDTLDSRWLLLFVLLVGASGAKELDTSRISAGHPGPFVNTAQGITARRLVRMVFGLPVVLTVLESTSPLLGTARYMSLSLRSGYCFWKHCSSRDAEASLSDRGVIRPLRELGVGPEGSRCLPSGFLGLECPLRRGCGKVSAQLQSVLWFPVGQNHKQLGPSRSCRVCAASFYRYWTWRRGG